MTQLELWLIKMAIDPRPKILEIPAAIKDQQYSKGPFAKRTVGEIVQAYCQETGKCFKVI